MSFNPKSLQNPAYIGILLLFCYFAFFFALGNKTLHIWDESRNGISAYEVSKNNSFLMPTYNGTTDMWNTKPPLLIDCQAVCIKLFGNNETAVRLPSAIVSTLTVLLIFLLISTLTKSKPLGFLAAGVFLATPGLLPYHALRQGDFEAFILFFSAAYSLAFLYYTERKNNRTLYWAMSLFTLAFLSKSSASLFFLPGIGIYILLKKELLPLLKNKHFYFSLLIPLIVLGGYYLLRESYNPGYIKAVYDNEFGGRAFTSIEGHSKPFLFYFNFLTDYALGWWYWLIPAGLLLTFFEKNKQVKNIFIFSLLLAFTHLLIISVTKTKLEWYCFPEVTFWVILSAISIYQIINMLTWFVKRPQIKEIVMIIAFIGVLYYPLQKQLKLVKFLAIEESWQKNVKVFLRDRVEKLIPSGMDPIVLISGNYEQNSLFYIYKLRDNGYNIGLGNFQEVKENTYVILDIADDQKMMESFIFCANIDTVEIFSESVKAFYVGKYRTEEEAILYAENFILSSAEYKNYIADKAEQNGVEFEVQLFNDADYLVKNARNKLGI